MTKAEILRFIKKIQADAWNEGFSAGSSEGMNRRYAFDNPYRESK